MATFNNSRLYDEKVVCPYDKAHVLTVLTIGKHLIKCEKRNLDIILNKCPFNATHRIKPIDMAQHLLECPNRSTVDSQFIEHRDPNRIKGSLAVPSYEPKVDIDDTENWEDEIDDELVCGYDPANNMNERIKFFDVTKHTTKSKKERMKMYTELHKLKEAPPRSDKFNVPALQKKENEPAPKEIRRPNKEAMAEKISNQPFYGLGRGMPRIAAGIFGSSANDFNSVQPVATQGMNSKMQGVRTNVSQPAFKGTPIERGRCLINQDMGTYAPKFVRQPPGFEKVSISQSDDNLDPLPEGEVKSVPAEVDKVKIRKKLEKKLKQIENLEKKRNLGDTLCDDEKDKLFRKADLLKQLSDLEL